MDGPPSGRKRAGLADPRMPSGNVERVDRPLEGQREASREDVDGDHEVLDMIQDFRVAIAQAWQVKQEMMGLDERKIWPYHLPELAATDQDISAVEACLGHRLDPRYRAFLLCANGWKAIYQTVDLFGTPDLVGGSRKQCAEMNLGLLPQGVLRGSGTSRSQLLPIAVTQHDRDLFAITRPQAAMPGVVIWFAGEEIDRFPTFDDFFLAMIEYNRVAVRRFRDGRSDASAQSSP